MKKGKTPGIYLTWNDCKAQTDGYSGAIYKSFQSAEEAENFVRGTAAAAGGNGAENGEETVQPDEDTAVAYVDGSYNVATGEYSCGVVFLYEGKEETMAQKGEDEELAQIRQKAERMERIAKAGGDWPLADQEFHMAIIKASHNEYMRRLYPIINSAVNEILQITENRQHMQNIALSDNRIIMDFLMKRDEAGARHAMSIRMKHLINTLQE